MPAQSKAQFRYIQALRSKYGSKDETPEEHKWAWEGDWTQGVDYKKLPEAVEKSATTVPPMVYSALRNREEDSTKPPLEGALLKSASIATLMQKVLSAKNMAKMVSPQAVSRRAFLIDNTRRVTSAATADKPVAGALQKALSAAQRGPSADAVSDLSTMRQRWTQPAAQPSLVRAGNPGAQEIITDAGETAARRMVAPTPAAPLPSLTTAGLYAGSYSRRGLLKRMMLSGLDPGVLPAAKASTRGLLHAAHSTAGIVS